MTWIVGEATGRNTYAQQLRTLILHDEILKLPGVFDPLSALLAKRCGFEALYFSGAAYSATRGLPDIGLVDASEVTAAVGDITRAAGLPLLVDIDTGFGSVINAARAARTLGEMGVAGLQIEDQAMPKACGHLEVKDLVSVDEAVARIRVIRSQLPEVVIMARTDARGVFGLDEAIERAKAFVEAGADIIFPEALRSVDEFELVREKLVGPLVANMTEFGKSPLLSSDELERMGYQAVIFPVSSLRMAAQACLDVYRAIKDDGTTRELESTMFSRSDLYDVIEYEKYVQLDQSVVPGRVESDHGGSDA